MASRHTIQAKARQAAHKRRMMLGEHKAFQCEPCEDGHFIGHEHHAAATEKAFRRAPTPSEPLPRLPQASADNANVLWLAPVHLPIRRTPLADQTPSGGFHLRRLDGAQKLRIVDTGTIESFCESADRRAQESAHDTATYLIARTLPRYDHGALPEIKRGDGNLWRAIERDQRERRAERERARLAAIVNG